MRSNICRLGTPHKAHFSTFEKFCEASHDHEYVWFKALLRCFAGELRLDGGTKSAYRGDGHGMIGEPDAFLVVSASQVLQLA